jgi:hypothetical protein
MILISINWIYIKTEKKKKEQEQTNEPGSQKTLKRDIHPLPRYIKFKPL